MRRTAILSLLLLASAASAQNAPSAAIENCLQSEAAVPCLLELAERESMRITTAAARQQALAKLLNAAAFTRITLPRSFEAANEPLRTTSAPAVDAAHRLDLLMAISNYRLAVGDAGTAEHIGALALYHHLSETQTGSARLALMMIACAVSDWPPPLAESWQPLADHGCSPAFLDETELPGETDRLMADLLAPVVFYRDDEFDAFEAAIDEAHATVRDMDVQMEDKADPARAAWQQLKAGIYLLHGESFLIAGDVLRARLSAAAAYAAVLAGEEILDLLLAEERAGVAGLLLRAGQEATAEQIIDETAQLLDAPAQRAKTTPASRVGFLSALVEILGNDRELLVCPPPDEIDKPEV